MTLKAIRKTELDFHSNELSNEPVNGLLDGSFGLTANFFTGSSPRNSIEIWADEEMTQSVTIKDYLALRASAGWCFGTVA